MLGINREEIAHVTEPKNGNGNVETSNTDGDFRVCASSHCLRKPAAAATALSDFSAGRIFEAQQLLM
jgi:hypothetical protein